MEIAKACVSFDSALMFMLGFVDISGVFCNAYRHRKHCVLHNLAGQWDVIVFGCMYCKSLELSIR